MTKKYVYFVSYHAITVKGKQFSGFDFFELDRKITDKEHVRFLRKQLLEKFTYIDSLAIINFILLREE